jgi:hypothetical protein
MAIKRRTHADPAAIEAFGAAADQPPEEHTIAEQSPAAPSTPAPSPVATATSWPAGVAKTHLIRWRTPDLALLLAEVSRLEDRSKHKTALRALQLGLEILRSEHTK